MALVVEPGSRAMRALRVLAGMWLALALLAPGPAGAAPARPVPVRSGTHRGFGRLVFDFPFWVGWRLERHGDVVRLSFSRALPFGPDPKLPRNVRALRDAPGRATVTVAPGARVRWMRLGARLVLDVLDPPRPHDPARRRAAVVARQDASARPAPGPARKPPAVPAPDPQPAAAAAPSDTGAASSGHAPGATRRARPVKVAAHPDTRVTGRTEPTPPPPVAGSIALPVRPAVSPPAAAAGIAAGPTDAEAAGAAAAPARPPAVTAALPVIPTAPPVGPVALAAAPVAAPAPAQAVAMLVPFEASVGAAAFRRAGLGVVVFDARRPIDLAALRDDPVFGTASVHLLAAGTEVILRLPPGGRIALRRRAAGWEVAVRSAPARGATIRPQVGDGDLLLPVPDPGRVVSLLDPETGAPLLVGTERGRRRHPGAGLAVIRRAPQFALLPSGQGVVVEALSDRLVLRAGASGFVLGLAGGRLALTAASRDTAALAEAALLTRRFHFPTLPTAALARRLRTEMAAAARRPPLARGPLLRRAARSMIALGMGAEAGALLRLAAAEDPDEGRLATHEGLAAVAALLAWHPRQAAGIDDPRLSGSDEVTLWRAVRVAELDPGAPGAAQRFAPTAPLILTYPRALRRRLLPLAAETMIAGDELAPAARLLAGRPRDPRLALARGMLAAAQGHSAAALAIYDRLADGADRLVRFRAATRAVALRLATHRIGPARAADALDRLRDAWRGGPRELALRETLAGLRAKAGQWRRALGLLRRTIAAFPAARPRLRAQMRHIFAAMLADPGLDRLPPLRFVALLDANTDLLPKGRAGERIGGEAGRPAACARSARSGRAGAGEADARRAHPGRTRRLRRPAGGAAVGGEGSGRGAACPGRLGRRWAARGAGGTARGARRTGPGGGGRRRRGAGGVAGDRHRRCRPGRRHDRRAGGGLGRRGAGAARRRRPRRCRPRAGSTRRNGSCCCAWPPPPCGPATPPGWPRCGPIRRAWRRDRWPTCSAC